jgi:hypothetical protein
MAKMNIRSKKRKMLKMQGIFSFSRDLQYTKVHFRHFSSINRGNLYSGEGDLLNCGVVNPPNKWLFVHRKYFVLYLEEPIPQLVPGVL